MGYDGSVNIDTKLDTKGFNKGTKSISSSLSGVMKSIAMVGKAMAAAFIGGSIISAIRSVIGSFDLMNSSIGGSLKTLSTSFASLKSSFASLVLTAFAPMIPYVIAAVNWLTKLFTTLAQVTAALFGTQVAMAGVADETAGAGKEAKKAAGALASFDQINVLSKQEDNAAAGASILPPGIVPDGLLDKVQSFKDKMLTFLQPVIDALGRLKDALLPLGETIWAGLKWAWDKILVPLGEWTMNELLPEFLDLLAGASTALNEALIALEPVWQEFYDQFLQPLAEWVGGKIIEFLEWLTEKLYDLADWIKENPEKFRTFATILGIVALAFAAIAVVAWLVIQAVSVWTVISGIAAAATSVFAIAVGILASPIFIVIAVIALLVGAVLALIVWWPVLEAVAKKAWQVIQEVWSAAYGWFTNNVTNPLKESFYYALNLVQDKFISIFEWIKGFVKGIINDIIGLINGMIFGVVGGVNGLVDGFNAVGSIIPGFSPASYVTAPQIPYLATGAVIPPNSEFMAVLGDQRNGRNIEAPEGLIRQIVSEEIGKITADITVNFAGSLSGLVRELKPYIDKENVRVGSSLIKSGATI